MLGDADRHRRLLQVWPVRRYPREPRRPRGDGLPVDRRARGSHQLRIRPYRPTATWLALGLVRHYAVHRDGVLVVRVFRVRAPFGDEGKAGRDRVEPGGEAADLRAGAEPDGLRGHQLVPLPGRIVKRRVHVTRQLIDRDIAAGRYSLSQRGDRRDRLRVVEYVGEREQQHDRDGLVEIKRLPRAGHDRGHVADVRVDVADGAAGRRLHQRPGVRKHHRVVVHVGDAALRHEGLRDLVRVPDERQADADVKELPDARVHDKEAEHTLLERAHGGRDVGYDGSGRSQGPRGPAVDLEVVLAP